MKTFTLELDSRDRMLAFGEMLAHLLMAGDIVYLQGELGAGKTTLATGLLHGFGYKAAIKSPTYTIVEPYYLEQQTVYHFDLYRLEEPSELLDMGFGDYLQSDALLLVEWPEKAEVLLPKPTLTCKISYQGEGRQLELTANCVRGEEILSKL